MKSSLQCTSRALCRSTNLQFILQHSTRSSNSALNLHGFTDNHTLIDKFKAGHCEDEVRCIHELEKCAVDLKVWMNNNWLKMNSDKTLFGSEHQLDKCITTSLNVNNTETKVAEIIRYQGVILDRLLNFKCHITSKCQMAMLNIQYIKNIRHLLTYDATETLVLGTVMSHLDYCNGILAGLLDMDISRMQCVQNIGAKMVVQNDTSRRDI